MCGGARPDPSGDRAAMPARAFRPSTAVQDVMGGVELLRADLAA